MTASSKTGIFCTSFDVELAWGFIDHSYAYPRLESIIRKGRECFFRLVALHEELSVPATWALVGHLLHDSCEEGKPHGHMPRPTSRWDRFSLCPCKDGAHHPLWHACDFAERLRKKTDLHDIACHTYSHLQYGQPEVTADIVEADLTAFFEAFESLNIRKPVSIIFPRHSWGHLQLVLNYGLQVSRLYGKIPRQPQQFSFWPTLKRRLSLLGILPLPVVEPYWLHGLLIVPASMCWPLRTGIAGKIPVTLLIRHSKNAIMQAVRTGKIVHFWSHEYNFAVDTGLYLNAYKDLLTFVKGLESKGDIRCMNLRGILNEYEKA